MNFYYETHDELRAYLADLVTTYNFAKRLKTLKGFAPCEHLQDLDELARAIRPRSLHQMPGLDI